MPMRATSGTAPIPAPDSLSDDLDANEYDITNIATLTTIVNGLVHLNGGTPAAASTLAAPPAIAGALLSDVVTWAIDTAAWLAALRTALVARGVVK